jgi:endogenous inhibitor of DNA gyrase (YacG/DUF329 family)
MSITGRFNMDKTKNKMAKALVVIKNKEAPRPSCCEKCKISLFFWMQGHLRKPMLSNIENLSPFSFIG